VLQYVTGLATFRHECNVPGLVQGLERGVLGTFQIVPKRVNPYISSFL
jgi:hypothetical protein